TDRRGVLALVGSLHQVVLELLMLLLFMLQLAFEPPPRRLRVFEFLFGAEMLFDRSREPTLEIQAPRGKRFDLFRQSLDFDVDVLQRDEMAQFGIQNCPLGLATEARRHRQGDKGTRGQGGKGTRRVGNRSPLLLFSLSPCLPLSLSPCLPLSLALWLCGINTVPKFWPKVLG